MTSIYNAVDAYQIAFSYRDIPGEVDLLLTWFDRHHGGAPGRVLELAAGPADHALEFARRGAPAAALDISGAMCARAREQAMDAGLALEVAQADMTDFHFDGSFDLALLMLDSASVLLSGEAMAVFLARIGRHLGAERDIPVLRRI